MECKTTRFMYALGAHSFDKLMDFKWEQGQLMQKVIFYSGRNKEFIKIHWMPITDEE